MYNKTSQPPEPYFGSVWGRVCRGRIWSPNIWGPSLLGAEFVRGRVFQGPSYVPESNQATNSTPFLLYAENHENSLMFENHKNR